MTAPAVAPLDRARARKLLRQAQHAGTVLLDVLRELHDGQSWLVLGHDSWESLCSAELAHVAALGRGLPKVELREAVRELRGRGWSYRQIGTLFGLAPNTVRAYCEGVELATVTGLDGKQHAATSSPAPAKRRGPRKTDRTVALLAGAGPDGLTVREVARALRCEQHKAAATLTRLEDAGRISYRAPDRRGLFGRWVAVS